VVIASLGMLYGTSAGAVDTALVMAGHSMLSLVNSVVVVLLNLGLNVVLIPRLGITGAAIAWAVAVVVRNVLAQVQVRVLNHLRLYGAPTAWVAALSLGVFGPVLLVLRVTEVSPWLAVPVLAVTTAVYASAMWRVRSVQLPDLAAAVGGRRRRGEAREGPPPGPVDGDALSTTEVSR
jgi:O-antigen/teichoic acid export membrane protein